MTLPDACPDHVVIVGDFADVNGGQAKVAIQSARLLAGAGHRVTFFAACGPVSPLLDADGIIVVCLDQKTILDDPNRMRAMRSGIWNGVAARALAQTLAACDPAQTVVHVHGYAKALSPAIGPVVARSGCPVVFTMHEYFLACPNGGFFNYQKQEICRLKPLGGACLTTQCDVRSGAHKAWRTLRGFVAAGPGQLPRAFPDIAYISETQRSVMAPYLQADVRLHRVDNPIEPPQSGAVQAAQNRHLMFVGRLSPEKGCTLLAEAAARAGMPVRFVGDGPEADAIRRLNPQAEITGWVKPQEVADHLAQARAFVFPSLWYEGQPLATLEALLRGIPVLCGRWNAAAEEITHGVNGLIFKAPTVEAITAALQDLPGLGPFDATALARRFAPATHLSRLQALYADVHASQHSRAA